MSHRFRPGSATRAGFTLIELLVVIAIIAVLIALLIPAIQKVREAANRARCANNLKQLALGVHNYESAHGCFPPGGKGYGFCTHTTTYVGDKIIQNMNGWVLVLPYLEQGPIYDQLNLSAAFGSYVTTVQSNGTLATPNATASGNAKVESNYISLFACPSDGGSRTIGASTTYSPDASTTSQKSNYDFIASNSDFGNCNYWKAQTVKTRYAFGENSNTRLLDISDGTTNTFMIGETTCNLADGITGSWGYRGWVQCGIDPGVRYAPNYRGVNYIGINAWYVPTVGVTYAAPYVTYLGQPAVIGTRGEFQMAGSLHPGGCHFAMCDASVRFVSESNDYTLLRMASYIADGTNYSLQ
jgi:prepilin-type N-terminal cleavage/methylation domain-containing protein